MANSGTPLADAEDINDDRYYKYIGENLILNYKSNNSGNLVTVIRRATDEYGASIVQVHRNPILYTREFEVELKNGETEKIMPNQIYAKLYSQLYNEGRDILQIKGIITHKKDGSTLTKET